MYRFTIATAAMFAGMLVWSAGAFAIDVNIADMVAYVDLKYGGETVRVMRIQDQNHTISGGFAKTSRPCPPFCFQPVKAAPGVETVGEVELVQFMMGPYRNQTGMIVDARTPEWFKSGTIPGSVNVPFTVFDDQDLEGIKRDIESGADSKVLKAFELFGVKPKKKVDGFLARLLSGMDEDESPWNFSQAKELLLFCNGPWCEQSPRAIRGLLRLGYPAEKLHYYRGGMQMWQMGGFTTVVPSS